MNNSYFLKAEQVREDSDERLDVLNKIGLKCKASDFAILLGCDCNTQGIGSWWLGDGWVEWEKYIVDKTGDLSTSQLRVHCNGCRPTINADLVIKKGTPLGINEQGVLEYSYLEYPQTIVNRYHSMILEAAYKNENLHPTGKKYVTDSTIFTGDYTMEQWDAIEKQEFSPREHVEYEFMGKKYIRFVADANCAGQTLSDGRKCVLNKPYWVQVEPMVWLIDKETNKAIAKQILFAGVQFENPITKYTITNFIDENFEGFRDNVKNQTDDHLPLNTDIKDQIDELDDSLSLSADTRTLLDRVNEVIKMLPPKEQELMLQRRNKLIEKYKTSIEKKDDFDIDKFSKPLRPRLALEEYLNPEVTLHAELYKLSCILTKQESLVKRIKEMNTCLALFQEDISSLPEETLTKEDMIRAIIFYSNKHHEYIGGKFKDKLETVLSSYKEECERELEHFSSEDTNQNELELTNYDENFELMSEIMDTLDKAVVYGKNIGVYADFIDKISSAIQGTLSLEEDEDSMASIIAQAKEAIGRLDDAKKESLGNELDGIVTSRISKIKEMLSSSEDLESTDLLTMERQLAEQLHPFFIKLDNTASRFEALKSVTEQVSNSRRILEERENVDDKSVGVIDSFTTDIHNSLISLKLSESDEKAVKERVGASLDKFSKSLEEMDDNQVQAIRNFSYRRDENHPLSVLQSSLAEVSNVLADYKHNQNDPSGQQTSRRI